MKQDEKFKTYGVYINADEEQEIEHAIMIAREAGPGKIRTGDAVRNMLLSAARKDKKNG